MDMHPPKSVFVYVYIKWENIKILAFSPEEWSCYSEYNNYFQLLSFSGSFQEKQKKIDKNN
jgi:hypothetical protein